LTASERLARKVELVRRAYGAPGSLLLEHPRARELYPACLTVGHHVSVGTVRLMEAAIGRAADLAPANRVAAALAPYLHRHLQEEMHGGEPGGGILDDLAAMGVDTAAVRAQLPSPKIAALVGAVYYWIFHFHPVAVLGYLELEALEPNALAIERLIEKTGLPRDGFRQLLLHAEIEAGHAEELHRVLDSLPLEPWHEQLIGLCALHSITVLTDALLDVVEDEPPVALRQPDFSDAL
jgi:hypothetical protein